MRTVLASMLALALVCPVVALAADRPVAGDSLTLKDPANVNGRAIKFKAAKDPAIDPGSGADPTNVGATLEVEGTNPGDGDTGSIDLPANLWRALGNPPGAKGYKFTDKTRSSGIKTLTLKPGANGGTISVSGGGSDWTYAITQAQGPITLRLTIGSDVYCAQFATSTYLRNEPGQVKAKNASAPASCSPPTGAVCGNGVAEAPDEECDDGGTAPGDGCSASCQLENASAVCAGVPSTPGTGIDSQLVASGLTQPLYVTAPPLDTRRLFIIEQDGFIRIVKDGVLLPTPFLDVEDDVACCGERGLLGLAFDPNYETNGVFFTNYTNNSGHTEVRRWTVSGNPDIANTTSTPVITINQDFSNHNGGHIQFGPDGYLYIAMGDGGSGGDPNERAQDPTQLLGKILRLDVSVSPYAIPPTNPFAGPGAPLDEIWALGVRNPWRNSFDRLTGDLYVADVGQNNIEEVNVTPAPSTGGENYGWDVFEGNACFEPTPPATSCPSPPTGFTFPVLTYNHSQGCSITGGYVYRGCALPDLQGTYFYSDICAGFIRSFVYSGGSATNQQDRTATLDPPGAPSIGGVSSFGQDARGEVYIVDYGNGSSGQGEVWKIVPGT
jgi:cysteine-rich repeat protein